MFASRTIAVHLLRGLIAAASIAWALGYQSSHAALALAAGVIAVIAMRGCPLCWTLGLVETIGARKTHQPKKGSSPFFERLRTSTPECKRCHDPLHT